MLILVDKATGSSLLAFGPSLHFCCVLLSEAVHGVVQVCLYAYFHIYLMLMSPPVRLCSTNPCRHRKQTADHSVDWQFEYGLDNRSFVDETLMSSSVS